MEFSGLSYYHLGRINSETVFFTERRKRGSNLSPIYERVVLILDVSFKQTHNYASVRTQ